jgi:hypothetical protein
LKWHFHDFFLYQVLFSEIIFSLKINPISIFFTSSDPDLSPTKAIQHVNAHDYAQWQQPPKPRFDTTYRTEYINRIRHPVCISKICFLIVISV